MRSFFIAVFDFSHIKDVFGQQRLPWCVYWLDYLKWLSGGEVRRSWMKTPNQKSSSQSRLIKHILWLLTCASSSQSAAVCQPSTSSVMFPPSKTWLLDCFLLWTKVIVLIFKKRKKDKCVAKLLIAADGENEQPLLKTRLLLLCAFVCWDYCSLSTASQRWAPEKKELA